MAVLTDQIVLFVGSLLIGAFGIHVGALVVTGTKDYGHAIVTALVGALVWSIASFLLSGVPYVGALLTLAAYLLVVKWRYSTSWIGSAAVALLAWIVAVGVLSVLSTLGVGSFEAIGIPRV